MKILTAPIPTSSLVAGEKNEEANFRFFIERSVFFVCYNGYMNWDSETLKQRGLITTGFHLPYNPGLIDLARTMRKVPTASEKTLWEGLLRNFKFRVLRQRPIDNFIVDFYCPKLKLVIEVDGASHFNDERKASDKERTELLKSYGLKVARFSDHEVLKHFSMVCDEINKLGS